MDKPWALVGRPLYFFLSVSWVGWVARGKEAGLPLYCLSGLLGGSDGWAAAKKLGSCWAPFIFLSFWILGRMDIIGLPECGLSLGSFHISFFLGLGSDGWAAAKNLGSC